MKFAGAALQGTYPLSSRCPAFEATMHDTFADGDGPIEPDEVERLRALRLDRASVRDVIRADNLDRVWKRLLSRLRKPRLQDFVLYRDAGPSSGTTAASPKLV